jgi:hypothetical protein
MYAMKNSFLVIYFVLIFILTGCFSNHIKKVENNLCEVCKKSLIDDSKVLLFENGNEHIYRCVHCALGEQFKYADSKIVTTSGVGREDITIERKDGEWSSDPSTLVVLSLPEAGGECLDRHLSFVNMEEYNRYLINNPYLAEKNPKAYSLKEIEELLKSGNGVIERGNEGGRKVYIQVVGFINHIPVKEMIADIDGVLNKYRKNIVFELIDEESENGQFFLEKKALKGHIPIVIFVDGEYQFRLNEHGVALLGHEGKDWEVEDLEEIIQKKLAAR